MNQLTRKKRIKLRMIIQIAFFVLIALIAVNHSLEEAGLAGIPFIGGASLHAVCPFGGVVSIYQLITAGTFVQKIHESAFVLFGIVLLLAVLFGPVFCGWICPFGTFQEFVSKIGKKIFKKRFNRFIPAKFDRYLRFLRYIVLALVVYMTAVSAKLLFSEIDPYYALFNFWTGEVAISAYLSLGVVIILSLFIERPFCKYMCPFGAVLGLTNLFRIFGIKRDKNSCISCDLCDRSCSMNIKIADKDTVRNHQCISCLECTSEAACPKEDTLTLKSGKYPKGGGV